MDETEFIAAVRKIKVHAVCGALIIGAKTLQCQLPPDHDGPHQYKPVEP